MIAIKNIGTQEFTSLEYGCFFGRTFPNEHRTGPGDALKPCM